MDRDEEQQAGPDGQARRPSNLDGVEPPFSEDDLQREQLGPRGVPGQTDQARMTPQRDKKTPKSGKFDGHTA